MKRSGENINEMKNVAKKAENHQAKNGARNGVAAAYHGMARHLAHRACARRGGRRALARSRLARAFSCALKTSSLLPSARCNGKRKLKAAGGQRQPNGQKR
jgi:hypothetical protein